MNATKRKFNTLLNGIGSKSTTSLVSKESREVNNGSPGRISGNGNEDAQPKKRRISTSHSNSTQEQDPSISKPVLSSSSVTVKHKKSQSLATGTVSAEPPKYAPWDRAAFLKRLKSFSNLTDWTPKPARVNEVEWAKRGWECKKFERVRCNLCNIEMVVKLNKKEVDGKEEPVYIAGNIEEALVDKYVELIITSHDEDCLWRKRGCDDTIFKLPLTHAPTTLQLLRQRYDELCARKDTLPYSFNMKPPPGFDLDVILSYLPSNFFTAPAAISPSETTSATINRVAFTMALFGWQGHTHERLGSQLGSVSCEACFRVLGLWLFKSKEVNEAGEEVTEAVVPGLNVVTEHRTYCPWRNPESQNGTKAVTNSATPALAGWEILFRVLKNECRLRTGSTLSPPAKERNAANTASVVGSPVGEDADDDTARSIRDEKDKERWTRLRRVKSLFETKGKKLQRNATVEKRKSRVS